jgi:hypothetical protein
VSDIDTAAADSLKVLDLKRPIREADIEPRSPNVCFGPKMEVGVCLDIKALSLYDNGHNLPLVVAGTAVSIATNPTRANPG